jgi:uncharacterized protein (UPF0332 family)
MKKQKLLDYFSCTPDLLEHSGVIKLFDLIEEQQDQINSLYGELSEIKINESYSKKNDLIAFLIELHDSCNVERLTEYSKEEILNNLKEYIENFAKDNKINLR